MNVISLIIRTGILILFVCIISCKPSKRYNEDTIKFGDYLKRRFHISIEKDSANYFLFSETGCEGCSVGLINSFSKSSRTYLIMSVNAQRKLLEQSSTKTILLIDSSGDINRLGYHNGNVGLIRTSRGNIDTIIKFEPVSMNQQIQFLHNVGL